jgi:NAD(P)H-hydrate repair Nnr-like enzyme with NAD(P)H-hydrate epimerase domain
VRLTTRQQAQKIDQETFTRAEIHSEVLNSKQMMNLAAQKCIEIFFKVVKPKPTDQIVVFCGPGNNGNDGKIIAEILISQNYQCQCLDWQSLSLGEINHFKKYTFIIDAIFGIGLSRKLSDHDIQKLKLIDDLDLPIFAVDTPTGLNIDTGFDWGYSLKAKWTCTIGWCKPGFYLNHGPEMCGQIFRAKLQQQSQLWQCHYRW